MIVMLSNQLREAMTSVARVSSDTAVAVATAASTRAAVAVAGVATAPASPTHAGHDLNAFRGEARRGTPGSARRDRLSSTALVAVEDDLVLLSEENDALTAKVEALTAALHAERQRSGHQVPAGHDWGVEELPQPHLQLAPPALANAWDNVPAAAGARVSPARQGRDGEAEFNVEAAAPPSPPTVNALAIALAAAAESPSRPLKGAARLAALRRLRDGSSGGSDQPGAEAGGATAPGLTKPSSQWGQPPNINETFGGLRHQQQGARDGAAQPGGAMQPVARLLPYGASAAADLQLLPHGAATAAMDQQLQLQLQQERQRVADLESAMVSAQSRAADLSTALARADAELQHSQQQQSEALEALRRREQSLMAERDAAQSSVSIAQERVAAAEAAAAAARRELHHVEARAAAAEREGASAAADASAVRAQLAATRRAAVDAAADAADREAVLRAELRQVDDAARRLREELAAARRDVADARRDTEEVEVEVRRLRTALADANASLRDSRMGVPDNRARPRGGGGAVSDTDLWGAAIRLGREPQTNGRDAPNPYPRRSSPNPYPRRSSFSSHAAAEETRGWGASDNVDVDSGRDARDRRGRGNVRQDDGTRAAPVSRSGSPTRHSAADAARAKRTGDTLFGGAGDQPRPEILTREEILRRRRRASPSPPPPTAQFQRDTNPHEQFQQRVRDVREQVALHWPVADGSDEAQRFGSRRTSLPPHGGDRSLAQPASGTTASRHRGFDDPHSSGGGRRDVDEPRAVSSHVFEQPFISDAALPDADVQPAPVPRLPLPYGAAAAGPYGAATAGPYGPGVLSNASASAGPRSGVNPYAAPLQPPRQLQPVSTAQAAPSLAPAWTSRGDSRPPLPEAPAGAPLPSWTAAASASSEQAPVQGSSRAVAEAERQRRLAMLADIASSQQQQQQQQQQRQLAAPAIAASAMARPDIGSDDTSVAGAALNAYRRTRAAAPATGNAPVSSVTSILPGHPAPNTATINSDASDAEAVRLAMLARAHAGVAALEREKDAPFATEANVADAEVAIAAKEAALLEGNQARAAIAAELATLSGPTAPRTLKDRSRKDQLTAELGVIERNLSDLRLWLKANAPAG